MTLVRKQNLNSWEEILIYAGVSEASEIDACDTWGSRIANIDLENLSEADRCSLAEHVKTCSACNVRIQEYWQIEEDARHLPSFVCSQYAAYHDDAWNQKRFSQFLQQCELAERDRSNRTV